MFKNNFEELQRIDIKDFFWGGRGLMKLKKYCCITGDDRIVEEVQQIINSRKN